MGMLYDLEKPMGKDVEEPEPIVFTKVSVLM